MDSLKISWNEKEGFAVVEIKRNNDVIYKGIATGYDFAKCLLSGSDIPIDSRVDNTVAFYRSLIFGRNTQD